MIKVIVEIKLSKPLKESKIKKIFKLNLKNSKNSSVHTRKEPANNFKITKKG